MAFSTGAVIAVLTLVCHHTNGPIAQVFQRDSLSPIQWTPASSSSDRPAASEPGRAEAGAVITNCHRERNRFSPMCKQVPTGLSLVGRRNRPMLDRWSLYDTVVSSVCSRTDVLQVRKARSGSGDLWGAHGAAEVAELHCCCWSRQCGPGHVHVRTYKHHNSHTGHCTTLVCGEDGQKEPCAARWYNRRET